MKTLSENSVERIFKKASGSDADACVLEVKNTVATPSNPAPENELPRCWIPCPMSVLEMP